MKIVIYQSTRPVPFQDAFKRLGSYAKIFFSNTKDFDQDPQVRILLPKDNILPTGDTLYFVPVEKKEAFRKLLGDTFQWQTDENLDKPTRDAIGLIDDSDSLAQFYDEMEVLEILVGTSRSSVQINLFTQSLLSPRAEKIELRRETLILNQYQLETEIVSKVWTATDLMQQEEGKSGKVVIRFFEQSFFKPGALKLLAHKFFQYKKLSHPHLASIDTLNCTGDKIFLAMEFLPGSSLRHLIETAGGVGISLTKAFHIVRAVGEVLIYLHGQGIKRVGLKPENVWYDEGTQTVKVIDDEIARIIRTTSPEGEELYASYETFLNLAPDPSDEVYALACISYELLSGNHPFAGKTSQQAEYEGRSPPALVHLNETQNQVLGQALAFRRKERTVTVEELMTVFATTLGELSSQSESALEDPCYGQRLKKLWVAVPQLLVIAILAPILIVGIGVMILTSDQAKDDWEQGKYEEAAKSERGQEGKSAILVAYREMEAAKNFSLASPAGKSGGEPPSGSESGTSGKGEAGFCYDNRSHGKKLLNDIVQECYDTKGTDKKTLDGLWKEFTKMNGLGKDFRVDSLAEVKLPNRTFLKLGCQKRCEGG